MDAPRTGLDSLLSDHVELVKGRRIGLLAHPASVTASNEHAAIVLESLPDVDLAALFGPEHGYDGRGAAGEVVEDGRHKDWGIPIYSLYGQTRRPTADMMSSLDLLLIDLQDLGVRCYTYVSTLLYMLEAAAAAGVPVIVTDRPIPLPAGLDGPSVEPDKHSFVAAIDAPLLYGMTPGETAQWLNSSLGLNVELSVIPIAGGLSQDTPTRWIPPSPAIRSWLCAQCYPATVYCEALPSLDCARQTDDAFQVMCAPWMNAFDMCAALEEAALPGVRFTPFSYKPEAGEFEGQQCNGMRLEVFDPITFKPVTVGIHILTAIRDLYGAFRVWGHADTRESFFDQLMGTSWVREALQHSMDAQSIVQSWSYDLTSFDEERTPFLLYKR